jgi:translation initiation factor 2 subunit 2
MAAMKYEEMLDRLYGSLPEKTKKHERFEMPTADSFIQGNKTIVKNFASILKIINRDEKHLFKFLAKETATSASIDDAGRLILTVTFSQEQVNSLLHSYIRQFILCPECSRPDTHVTEKQGVKMLKCEACGAVSAVRGL